MAASENQSKTGELANDDLDTRRGGLEVARSSEVESKTTPNLRKETRTDNGKTFERDFTLKLFPGDVLTDELKERQNIQVRMDAEARGLIPTGPVKLAKVHDADEYGNVRLVYSVPVRLNGDGGTPPEALVSVSEQPHDTPADIPEGTGDDYVERRGSRRDVEVAV